MKFCSKIFHTYLYIIASRVTHYYFIASQATKFEMNQSQRESQQTTMKYIRETVIKGRNIIGTTETGPFSKIVLYTVVGLMAVFVIIVIFYGVSYCPKLYNAGKRNAPNTDESVNAQYEDLPLS